MTAVNVASESAPGHPARSAQARSMPLALSRCRRVVAITVALPEFLRAAAGLAQRLGAAGVPIDLLDAALVDDPAERAAVAALARLEVAGLVRHRLALPTPISERHTDDLVAAMSELVGFDPEPGVYCLTPGAHGTPPSPTAVGTAAGRIAEVYRLRLVRFSVTPDRRSTQIELSAEEWRRKCDALAACADEVTPPTGSREYFET